MSRRVLAPKTAAHGKALSRMAPGGKLWSETEILPRWEVIGEGGEGEPGTPPLQVDWHGHDTYTGFGASPGMTGTRQIFTNRNTADLTGDITAFLFYSSRRLHGITFPPQWSRLDGGYVTGFGLDAVPGGTPQPATWEWGILMCRFSDGVGPPYEYTWTRDEYPNTPSNRTPYWGIGVSNYMFRGGTGGQWLTERVANAAPSASPTFRSPDPLWQVKFQLLFLRACYAGWVTPPGPPPTIPSPIATNTFAGAWPNPVSPGTQAGVSWNTPAQTDALFVNGVLVDGTYTYTTFSTLGIPAWQMLNVGWIP